MNRKSNRRYAFLVVMSFIFYGWWDWRFLFLITGSGLIDYFTALAIVSRPKSKKVFLWTSLIGNLGSLAFFKYYILIASTADYFLGWMGIQSDLAKSTPGISLTGVVGISFYTFQSMSYTIDVYRGRLQPTRNLMHFFAYLAMFPQLVAGPIVRARDMLIQLTQQRIASDLQKWNGIKLFVFGLFQKTVLADNIGAMVNRAYSEGNTENGTFFWWLVLVGFAFQIYCDFSGYSLMARGLAKFMGYHLKMNFNHPYLSGSFRSFWSRWHISLSTWFRDYVYIPLGGSKKGIVKGIFFMTITMVVSGLWHGAWYTFLCWGLLHAVYLAIERLTKWPAHLKKLPLGKLLATLIVFVLVTLAWNFFRSATFEQSLTIFRRLFGFIPSGEFGLVHFNALFFLVLAVIIECFYALYRYSAPVKSWYKSRDLDIGMTTIAFVLSLFFRGPAAEFIYFQF